MEVQGISPHESMELHELLTFKNTCLTKSITMSPLVGDDELKAILQQDVAASQHHIREIRDLLTKSSIFNSDSTED